MLLRFKLSLARALTRDRVGRLITYLTRGRIWHRGVWVDATGAYVKNEMRAMLFWQMYESAETRFVQRFLRSDLDVVELGSSLGVVSSHIARRLAPGRRLVCVEANPQLLSTIKRNVETNAAGVPLHVIHGAIAYTAGNTSEPQQVPFAIGGSNIASSVTTGSLPREVIAVVDVPALRLSDIIARHGIEEYALVCDIEGAEVDLLREDRAVLLRCRQLIIELHDTVRDGRLYTPSDVADMIAATGLTLRARHGPVCTFERP